MDEWETLAEAVARSWPDDTWRLTDGDRLSAASGLTGIDFNLGWC
jgi:hypothetical protein